MHEKDCIPQLSKKAQTRILMVIAERIRDYHYDPDMSAAETVGRIQDLLLEEGWRPQSEPKEGT